MSSTNRGAERRTDDVYETPSWCVTRLLEAWGPRWGELVEPCSGSGQIVKRMTGGWIWHTCDIREIDPAPSLHHVTGDFLARDPVGPQERIGAVITNPPFSLAEEFIRHSRAMYPRADLVFLLRLNFLGSEKRHPLWRDLGAPDVYVFPNRPDFSGGGGDSCEYAWFVWPPDRREFGKVRVLNLTPRSER